MPKFLKCPNGHYYLATLPSCPYCVSQVNVETDGQAVASTSAIDPAIAPTYAPDLINNDSEAYAPTRFGEDADSGLSYSNDPFSITRDPNLMSNAAKQNDNYAPTKLN